MKYITIIITALLVTFYSYSIFLNSINASTQVFSDVTEKHSNFEDIMFLLEKGVIEPSNTYGVNDVVTREEVAIMIAKAVGLDGTQRNTKFNVVPKSNANSGYIQSAVDAGIIYGYEDGTFRPYQKVTRGHVAVFIARAFNLNNGSKTFKDVPKESSLYTAVTQLAASGITTGYADGTFKPSNNLTRGHISAFLVRAIQHATVNHVHEVPNESAQSKSNKEHSTNKETESIVRELMSKYAKPKFGLASEELLETYKNDLQLLLIEQNKVSLQLEKIKLSDLYDKREKIMLEAQKTRDELDISQGKLTAQRELISALNQKIKDYRKDNKSLLSGTDAQKEKYKNALAKLQDEYGQQQTITTSLNNKVKQINKKYADIKYNINEIDSDISAIRNLITFNRELTSTISKVKIKIYDIEKVATNAILKKAIEDKKLELTSEEAEIILNQLITYQYKGGKDIPIPGGLSADEALQKAKYEFDRVEGAYGGLSGVNITSHGKSSNLLSSMKATNYSQYQKAIQKNTSSSIIYLMAHGINVPLAEFVKAANYTVETGNVYYGENFILYYQYEYGMAKFRQYDPNIN